jgi:hypothetical protein
MIWGKRLILSLGLMLITHVAYARDIESFTDDRGTLHITNLGAKKPASPVNSPSPTASLQPGSLPRHPVTPPARNLAPEAHSPVPGYGPGPARPAQVPPRPGSRITHNQGLGGMRAGWTGDQDASGPGPGAPSPPLTPVSWAPPQPVREVPDGKIVIKRDRQGVIHITNVPMEGEGLAAPRGPAPAVQMQAPPPAGAPPALQLISCPVPGPALVQKPPGPAPPVAPEGACPELGPEVADYLGAKLRGHASAATGQTIRGYRDPRGVLHIVNDPSPDPPLPQPQLASSGGETMTPVTARSLPPLSTAPAMPGSVQPPPGATGPMVVARRDPRGVLHIFSRGSVELLPGQESPGNFLGRVSPALQACINEAAQLYDLPIPLILAIIRKESNFTQQAVSPKGAMGLMQLMPGTAASLGVRDPFDPRENILAGCRYFRFLLNYFKGNLPLALAGYNAGHHRVISAGFRIPAIKETQEFVTQVMGLYYLLDKHAANL